MLGRYEPEFEVKLMLRTDLSSEEVRSDALRDKRHT